MHSLENFLINEREHLKTLIIPLIETKDFLIQNEPDVFHDEIMNQFKDRLGQIIIDEYSKSFTMTPEEAIMILEGIELEEFFKC